MAHETTTSAAASRETMALRWSDAADKLVALAEAMPERALELRPTPAMRSVAEQLLHVAFWNRYLRDTLRGAPADGSANALPRDAYPERDAIVRVLAESFDEVRTELREGDGELAAETVDAVVGFVQHAAEHYGQLVVYARLQGIVPPTSRAEA